MAIGDVVRLRNIRNYFSADGRSWTEFKPIDKNEVFVALILGFEPLKMKDQTKEMLNIEDVILSMAKNIQEKRKTEKAAMKAVKDHTKKMVPASKRKKTNVPKPRNRKSVPESH